MTALQWLAIESDWTAAEMDFFCVLLAQFLLNIKRHEYCGVKIGQKGKRYVKCI